LNRKPMLVARAQASASGIPSRDVISQASAETELVWYAPR
jgi:hypothetical protein